MKLRIWVGGTLIGVVFLLIMSGVNVSAFGPGTITGTTPIGNPPDPDWSANPGWSNVYDHPDSVFFPNSYWTGVSFWDVYYEDTLNNDPNGPDYYIKEITIPWIAFHLSNGQWLYIDHNDVGGSSMLHLLDTGANGYGEGNGAVNLLATYNLDVDQDGNCEWQFKERIDLFDGVAGGGGAMQGNGDIEIMCTAAPQQNQILLPGNPNPVQISEIVYSFLLDADVYNNAANNMAYWGGQGWIQMNSESTFTVAVPGPNGNVGRIQNPFVNPLHQVYIQSLPLNQPISELYYALACGIPNGGEYSQDPSNYINGGNLQNADGVYWYVETITINGQNWPPNGINWGWSGLAFNGLTA